METMIIIQSSVIAVLIYYAYVAHKSIHQLSSHAEWTSNEVYALKTQVQSVYFSEMKVKPSTVGRKPVAKSVTNSKPSKKEKK